MSVAAHTLENSTRVERYQRIRGFSEWLCEPLSAEDLGLQACPEVSPPRWHLAHTTWFFETFVLKAARPGYQPWNPAFEYLFNSYYNGIGQQYPRPQRHLLSRPGMDEVLAWRRHVDDAMTELLGHELAPETAAMAELGLHHEQQHQELLVTDLKYSLSHNPLYPVYRSAPAPGRAAPLSYQSFEGGLVEIGAGDSGFAFDNERPRHRVWLEPFWLANRPVSCDEYQAFIADHGYERPELWLSDGWDWVRAEGASSPLYWQQIDGTWWHYTLGGLEPVNPEAPVAHLNYYEADAYARWAGRRLPTEAEWEHAACDRPVSGHFVEQELWHPAPADGAGLVQMFGDIWEWTASAYLPYPGFRPPAGAVGEYNGKFMCNQMVLRGGSCASATEHLRASYRNFFYPDMRWQFSGLRLADDAGGRS
jgi:ergothioneine biosynthesis protein EgtB